MKAKITLPKYCRGARKRVGRLMTRTDSYQVMILGEKVLQLIEELETTGTELEQEFIKRKVKNKRRGKE